MKPEDERTAGAAGEVAAKRTRAPLKARPEHGVDFATAIENVERRFHNALAYLSDDLPRLN